MYTVCVISLEIYDKSWHNSPNPDISWSFLEWFFFQKLHLKDCLEITRPIPIWRKALCLRFNTPRKSPCLMRYTLKLVVFSIVMFVFGGVTFPMMVLLQQNQLPEYKLLFPLEPLLVGNKPRNRCGMFQNNAHMSCVICLEKMRCFFHVLTWPMQIRYSRPEVGAKQRVTSSYVLKGSTIVS